MNKNQSGFAIIEIVVILVVLGVTIFVGWYILNNKTGSPTSNINQAQQTQSNSTGTYKILGTENYICTKSKPAQCHGNIKVQLSGEAQKLVSIDKDTDFNSTDPGDLYKSNKNPLNAKLELDGDLVKNIKLL